MVKSGRNDQVTLLFFQYDANKFLNNLFVQP